jgi:hypothetical protein
MKHVYYLGLELIINPKPKRDKNTIVLSSTYSYVLSLIVSSSFRLT